jgi:hypothetical protein
MKTYYATRDILPTPNHHFLTPDLKPDMTTVMYFAGEIMSKKTVDFIKTEYGKDFVGSFQHTGVFSQEYRDKVYSVKLDNDCIAYFVKL